MVFHGSCWAIQGDLHQSEFLCSVVVNGLALCSSSVPWCHQPLAEVSARVSAWVKSKLFETPEGNCKSQAVPAVCSIPFRIFPTEHYRQIYIHGVLMNTSSAFWSDCTHWHPISFFRVLFFRVCYHKDHRIGVNHFGGCLFEQRQQSFGGTQLGMALGGWFLLAPSGRHAIGRGFPVLRIACLRILRNLYTLLIVSWPSPLPPDVC